MSRVISPPSCRVRLRPALASGVLGLAVLALAACDTSKALEDTKDFFKTAGRTIDDALGIGPSARYDKLEEEDVKMAAAAKQNALETRRDGEPTTWRNVKTGNSGSITPVRTYVTENGVFCRDYREVVSIGVDKGEATSTGCRTSPKSWTSVG